MIAFGWSQGELYAVVAFGLFMVLALVGIVVGMVSEKWGERVAAAAFLLLFVGIVLAATTWSDPIVVR